jgi:glucose-1-phosphate adenylyltransferase
MGNYIFDRHVLVNALNEDADIQDSNHDFGKNVIPMLLNQGKNICVYNFKENKFAGMSLKEMGYWRDVGCIDAYWQANMDLVGDHPAFDLFLGGGRIFSRSDALSPQFIGEEGEVTDSIISQGCRIFGKVTHSVLSPGVIVEKGATVTDSVLMSGVRISEGASVSHAILDESVTVACDTQIGTARKLTVIGREKE